jgi:hypothetical protein
MGAVAPALVIAACSVDLGIEDMRYRCQTTAQCSFGFVCDEDELVCKRESDPTPIDGGTMPCGFDEEFNLLDPPDWQRNGNASANVGNVQLTRAEPNQRGTIWYEQRVFADRFTFEMEFSITGGGTQGGAGMAMAWIMEDATSRGGVNANLAAYGLTGYVVEIDTLADAGIGDPGTEHIAFAGTHGDVVPNIDQYGATTELEGSLRSQPTRVLEVDFEDGVARISLDNQLVLTASVANYSPFDATFGATAATGTRYDSHAVHRLSLICH